MNTADKIALINSIVALVGVLVTGFFSYLVWKVSKENAKAALITAEIAKSTYDKEKMIEELTKRQYADRFMKLAFEARMVIFDQSVDINFRSIKKIPRNHFFSENELATYFSNNQISAMDQFFREIETYLERLWLKPNGDFIDTLNGSDIKRIKEESGNFWPTLDTILLKFMDI